MSVYLHVPFCVSRCIYCDFYVTLEKYGGQDAYVEAVLREIELRLGGDEPSERIRTVYVGGGTPSLLKSGAYVRIVEALRRRLVFEPDAEITLEANPDAKRSQFARAPEDYLKAGFNRISVGIQSLNDTELKKLSRTHTAAEAMAFVGNLQRAGWRNIAVDLMYGLPLQTMASWRETLRKVVSLEVQHVSMYGLKVEEGTPLERLSALPGGGYATPGQDALADFYEEGVRMLSEAGFRRYEFSNFARPGFESRHNLNYWDNGEYLGLGVSAHGYRDGVRYENIRDLAGYLADPLAGTQAPCPPEERLENAVIFGLRKTEGVDVAALEAEFGICFRERYAETLAKYGGEFLQWRGNRLSLSDRGVLLSNLILADFLNDSD